MDNRVVRTEAAVDGKWELQDECTATEFLEANPDLDVVYKAQVARMAKDDVLHMNLGCHGIYRITRIE